MQVLYIKSHVYSWIQYNTGQDDLIFWLLKNYNFITLVWITGSMHKFLTNFYN